MQNLVKNGQSGIYYARVMVSGKTKWRSLDTKTFTVAKLRLADTLRELRAAYEVRESGREVSTMGGVVVAWLREVEQNLNSPGWKQGQVLSLKRVLKTWPGFESRKPGSITAVECGDWLRRFRKTGTGFVPPGSRAPRTFKPPSASGVNKSLDALRGVFEVAIRLGLRADNPAMTLKRPKVTRAKVFFVPSVEELYAVIDAIRAASRNGAELAWLCEFMAWTGTGPDEASKVRGRDVYFSKGLVHIRGTKREARDRWLPMSEPLRSLLNQITEARGRLVADDPLFKYKTFKRSLTRACELVGIPRLTHYDLRHFFCTHCLEKGVSVRVLADWMGHADNGSMLLRTYGHVRMDHAMSQAQLLTGRPVEAESGERRAER